MIADFVLVSFGPCCQCRSTLVLIIPRDIPLLDHIRQVTTDRCPAYHPVPRGDGVHDHDHVHPGGSPIRRKLAHQRRPAIPNAHRLLDVDHRFEHLHNMYDYQPRPVRWGVALK